MVFFIYDMDMAWLVWIIFLLVAVGIAVTVGYFTHWFGLATSVDVTTAPPFTDAPSVTAAPAAVTAAPAAVTAAPAAVTAAPVPYTYINNLLQTGNDLTSPTTAATLDLCRAQCASTAGCMGISYGPTSQQCWLKKGFANSGISFASGSMVGAPVGASTFPSTLVSSTNLLVGGALVSPGQKYALIVQTDGNVVVYNLASGAAVWATNTTGRPNLPLRLGLQNDADLVVYDSANNFVWGSLSAGKGNDVYTLTMQDDGNLVVYSSTNQAIWASNTVGK